MTATETRYYRALRQHWGQTAQTALQMARAYAHCKDAGVNFVWESEQESPVDVFGEPSSYTCDCGAKFYVKGDCPNCHEPRVTFHDTGCYFDPTAEFESCVLYAPNPEREERLARSLGNRYHEPEVLASLSMIDGAHARTDYQGYWFMVECELALEAVDRLDAIVMDGAETEETLA
jgi:hypothetical protein